jgi:hypothetical protein
LLTSTHELFVSVRRMPVLSLIFGLIFTEWEQK